jgi:hypothetical protein
VGDIVVDLESFVVSIPEHNDAFIRITNAAIAEIRRLHDELATAEMSLRISQKMFRVMDMESELSEISCLLPSDSQTYCRNLDLSLKISKGNI